VICCSKKKRKISWFSLLCADFIFLGSQVSLFPYLSLSTIAQINLKLLPHSSCWK